MRRQQNPNHRGESLQKFTNINCPCQDFGKRVEESSAVIMPPGCDIPPDYNLSIEQEYDTYTAAEYAPEGCGELPVLPHGMTGSFNLFSVPSAENASRHIPSLSEYLDSYKGKYVCLDFWNKNNSKSEKCGILQEVGADFLAIRPANGKSLMVVDLSRVRYISIYCM